jgi:protein phosphatase
MAVAGLTDVGRERDHNEDGYLIDEALALLLVADGMGGHAMGEVASKTAIETIADVIYEHDPELFSAATLADPGSADNPTEPCDGSTTARDPDDTTVDEDPTYALGVIQTALANSNRKINEMNRARNFPEGSGMGTTIVGLWRLENDQQAIIFHVGDSRVYRYRSGRLVQLTRDHTLYQEWLDDGGHGVPPNRNIITRAIGPSPEVEVDASVQYLVKGDVFLLCSDGLTGMMDDDVIEQTLRSHSDLAAICEALVRLANDGGGTDNITVTLARCL